MSFLDGEFLFPFIFSLTFLNFLSSDFAQNFQPMEIYAHVYLALLLFLS